MSTVEVIQIMLGVVLRPELQKLLNICSVLGFGSTSITASLFSSVPETLSFSCAFELLCLRSASLSLCGLKRICALLLIASSAIRKEFLIRLILKYYCWNMPRHNYCLRKIPCFDCMKLVRSKFTFQLNGAPNRRDPVFVSWSKRAEPLDLYFARYNQGQSVGVINMPHDDLTILMWPQSRNLKSYWAKWKNSNLWHISNGAKIRETSKLREEFRWSQIHMNLWVQTIPKLHV